jgi:hypothetical protein
VQTSSVQSVVSAQLGASVQQREVGRASQRRVRKLHPSAVHASPSSQSPSFAQQPSINSFAHWFWSVSQRSVVQGL